MYIFYNKDLKVMGMSNDVNSMEFPSVEIAENYHSSTGYDLIEEDGKIKVKPKPKLEPSFEKEEEYRSRKRGNRPLEEYRKRVEEGKSVLRGKMADGKITIKDLAEFITNYL